MGLRVLCKSRRPEERPIQMGDHELRLLDIETARVRHAWAKAQIKDDGTTPALTKYLKESLEELAVLRANDVEMDRRKRRLQTGGS